MIDIMNRLAKNPILTDWGGTIIVRRLLAGCFAERRLTSMASAKTPRTERPASVESNNTSSQKAMKLRAVATLPY